MGSFLFQHKCHAPEGAPGRCESSQASLILYLRSFGRDDASSTEQESTVPPLPQGYDVSAMLPPDDIFMELALRRFLLQDSFCRSNLRKAFCNIMMGTN